MARTSRNSVFSRRQFTSPKPEPFDSFTRADRAIPDSSLVAEEGMTVQWKGYRASFLMVIRAMRRGELGVQFGLSDVHSNEIVGWVTASRLSAP